MDQATKEVELKFLADLEGDNPLIMGMDYYNVIYGAAAMLVVSMFVLYVTTDDDAIK